MEDRELLREVLRKLDDLETGVTRLVEAIEADDKYRERLEKLAEKERDDRHEQVEDALNDLRQRIENVGAGMRDLPGAIREMPERLLQHVKKTVYELRTAEWQALQAGVMTTPMPARDPTPLPYREQTGKIAVPAPAADDIVLTPAQQRGLVKVVVVVWKWGRWALLPAAGVIEEWLRRGGH
jgi:hypothetical protein